MVGKDKIGFSLQQIKTEQFAVLEKNYSSKKAIELGTGIQFKIDSKNHLIGTFLSVTFEQTKKSFLKIEVSCHFEIEKTSWINFIDKKANTIIFPKGFLAHMAMITVGTSRGILFSKTEDTEFSKFIVPTINVAEMIDKDAKFPLEKTNVKAIRSHIRK